MSSVSATDVRHLAHLARLELTDDEVTQFSEQLTQILGAVETVSEAVGEDTPATSHPIVRNNVFRPDEPQSGLSRDEALAAAPATDGERFIVPRILGTEE